MLAAAMLILAQAAPAAEIRTVTITAIDEKGAPIEGLVPEELALAENGVTREISRLVLERRPLTVAFLLDTSEAVGSSFRPLLREPVIAFLRGLPEGSVYTLWTTGDRPTRLVDFTKDPNLAARALDRVSPQGGNTMLDAIVEASSELNKKEAERSAVVILTATGPEFSSRERTQVVDSARANANLFLALEVTEGQSDFQTRGNYDYVLSELTSATGGFFDRILSFQGVKNALQWMGAALRGQYLLSYLTTADAKQRKLEVTVARPGAQVRVGPPPRSRKAK